MASPNCIGIDGCPAGWVGATRDGVLVESTFAALLGRAGINPATDVAAVDMPIGLAARGRRRCEELARERLKPYRHSSVFWVPTRRAIRAETQDEASRINRACGAKGVSAQAFNLLDKIREIDALLCDEPRWRRAVHEVHPELCFAAMNGEPAALKPLAYPKKSGLGAYRRLSLLFERFDPEHFKQARAAHAYTNVADDDIADAYACLFSAAASAASEEPDVAIVIRDFSNPYWQALRDGAIAEGKKVGVPVTVQAGKNETDTVGENNKISTMANQPYNCYGVVPVNGTNVITPLMPISRRGMPIINLDTALNAKAVKQSGLEITSFIGSDNHQAGRIAARHMLKALNGKDEVAILEGILGEQNGINRETAVRKAVKGKLDIVQATPADYDRDKALNKTEAMLRAHPDIKGIFAANDLMGLGAARAVLNAGKKDQITVVSIDGVTEAIKAVKKGTLSATISQYPYAEGEMAVQACQKLVKGEKVPNDVTSPIKLITRDNADQALKSFPKPFFRFDDPFGQP